MAEIVAYSLGARQLPGDAEPVELVHIDGFDRPVSESEALALGATIKRVAFLDYASRDGRDMIRLADLSQGSRERAERDGFAIEPMPKAMRAAIAKMQRDRESADANFREKSRATARKLTATKDMGPNGSTSDALAPIEDRYAGIELTPYAQAILTLDAARLRPEATRKLLSIHNETSLPVYQADAILSAIPAEISIKESHQVATMNANTKNDESGAAAHALVKRTVELRAAALELRGEKGDTVGKAEAKRLRAALAHCNSTGSNIVAALHQAGADVPAVVESATRHAR